MGLFRDIGSAVTGIPLGGTKRSSSNSSSDNSDSTNPDDTGASSDYGEDYGTRVLRAVKRSARRITDKGSDR